MKFQGGEEITFFPELGRKESYSLSYYPLTAPHPNLPQSGEGTIS